MPTHLRTILAALALAVTTATAASAQSIPAARRDSVLTAIRAYVDASNRVDVQAMLDAYSQSPSVSSAALGDIRRGFAAIRAQADSAAGMEGQMRFSLGAIDVTGLGPSNALAVSTLVVRVETGGDPIQIRGAITLVLERVGGKWKILHDHFSLPLPEE